MSDPEPSTSRQSDFTMNLNLCVLCQTDTGEVLLCPARSKNQNNIGAGYRYVADSFVKFYEIDALPFSISIENLDEGNGIKATLQDNNAKWNQTCRSKLDTQKLQRAQKRKESDVLQASPVKTRRSIESKSQSEPELSCIFCEDEAGPAGFHKASTFDLDFKVKKCTTDLQDRKLLSKLAGGDMVAIDAHYHMKCFAKLYRRANQFQKDPGLQFKKSSSLHGIAFAELVTHLQSLSDSDQGRPVFNLSELKKLYSTRLLDLGVYDVTVHSTRLKNRILAAIPGLRAYNEGREVLLAFDKDVGLALRQACKEDFDSEALTLAKVAKIIRRDIFEMKQSFGGNFPAGCNRFLSWHQHFIDAAHKVWIGG